MNASWNVNLGHDIIECHGNVMKYHVNIIKCHGNVMECHVKNHECILFANIMEIKIMENFISAAACSDDGDGDAGCAVMTTVMQRATEGFNGDMKSCREARGCGGGGESEGGRRKPSAALCVVVVDLAVVTAHPTLASPSSSSSSSSLQAVVDLGSQLSWMSC
ncbi:hypothetical protein LWI29_002430 [Acer saccharum]|uniref:Uncharacterized protein n=1 Tax=Acer saccharum TaxID=4024 RepID=A0AA39S8R7_ACESA|nr:hypothetical protein LWI29_002430 [Acer saccharum]